MSSIRVPLSMLSVVIFFHSCTKQDSPQSARVERIHKIVYRDGDSAAYRSFKYDMEGKLSVIEDSNAQTHMGRTFIYYDERNKINKLVRKNYYGSLNYLVSQWTDSLLYNNDRLTGSIMTYPQRTGAGYSADNTFGYDEQGRLTADTGHYTNPSIAHLTRFVYDGRDNVVQIEEISYMGSAAHSIIRINYNLKDNPYKQLGTAGYLMLWDPSLALSKNAPREVIYRDHSKYFSYEYYANGLTKRISATSTGQYASSRPETTEFFYE